MASESEIVSTIASVFGSPNPDVIIGIGDDGAVTKPILKNLVLSTDMAVEGVHFKRSWSSFHEIGAKITAANLADIFAMGGHPKYLLVSVGIPKELSISDLRSLAQGIKSEADLVSCSVVGGDISSASELVISISAIGEVAKPLTRSGAKVGDKVFISNLTGLSAAGLSQLSAGILDSKFIKAHKKPKVLYEVAANFEGASAAIDVSDGLLSECKYLAEASKVGIQLEADLISKLPNFEELSKLALEMKIDIWSWILSGGEDHAFLGCGPILPEGTFQIGEVIEGSGVKVNGASEIKEIGWRHF